MRAFTANMRGIPKNRLIGNFFTFVTTKPATQGPVLGDEEESNLGNLLYELLNVMMLLLN